MLSLISPILLLGAIASAAFNKQWHRVACAFAIIIPTCVHYHYFDITKGWEYYGSAIAFSILAIALLQAIKPNDKPSELVVHLQIISLVLAATNLFGYIMWYEYYSPIWYNSLVLVLVVIESLRLFLHTDGDKQDGTDGVYYNCIARHSRNHLGGRG
jgi:hypothetical protein